MAASSYASGEPPTTWITPGSAIARAAELGGVRQVGLLDVRHEHRRVGAEPCHSGICRVHWRREAREVPSAAAAASCQ